MAGMPDTRKRFPPETPTTPKKLLPPRMVTLYEPVRLRAYHKTPAPTKSTAKRTRRPSRRRRRRFSIVFPQRLVFGSEQPIPCLPLKNLPSINVKRPSRVPLACAGPRVAFPLQSDDTEARNDLVGCFGRSARRALALMGLRHGTEWWNALG